MLASQSVGCAKADPPPTAMAAWSRCFFSTWRRAFRRSSLARGHARVAAKVDLPLAAELLARAAGARQRAGSGRVGSCDSGGRARDRPVAERGRFTEVEGKVFSVRESGGTIYMNFGRRWSEALTVTILKRDERIFAGAGLQPSTLENRRLRVRGYVEERNGPRIEAKAPEQIEIADRN